MWSAVQLEVLEEDDEDPIDGHQNQNQSQSLNGSQVASSLTPTCLAPQIGHHGAKLLVVGETAKPQKAQKRC